jgi:hypothetical protein
LFSFVPFENSPVGIWFKAVSQYLSPLERHATPTSNQQIMARLNEITFNSPLKGELRAIEFIARLIDQGRPRRGIGPGKYRRIYMHRIALEDSAKALNSVRTSRQSLPSGPNRHCPDDPWTARNGSDFSDPKPSHRYHPRP